MGNDNGSSSAVQTNDASTAKARRVRMGKLAAPIVAAAVYRKDQTHDFGGKKGVSWAIVTPDGKLVKATTYGGDLGKDFNLGDHNTQALAPENTKDRRKQFKGYSKDPVPATEYPAFVTTPAPAAKDEAPAGDAGSEDEGGENA